MRATGLRRPAPSVAMGGVLRAWRAARPVCACAVAVFGAFPCAVAAQSGDIVAGVTTSLGAFTIKLRHDKSPKTVANFMRLAAGTAPWIDEATGVVHFGRPFYGGTRFHKVIAGALSAAGSRDGFGQVGPGYYFRDELNNGLSHSAAYLVSMVNEGPNTNGSMFQVTAAALPSLNGKNVVFGEVIKGHPVCDAINSRPVDSNGVPLTPVVIHSVSIQKSGGVVFNEHAQGLPVVSAPKVVIQHSAAGDVLVFPRGPRTLCRCHLSGDLESWSAPVRQYLDHNAATQSSLDLRSRTAGMTRQFFTPSLVTYSDAVLFPRNTSNRTFTIVSVVEVSTSTLTLVFNSSGTGTYTLLNSESQTNGTIQSSIYTPDGYGAWLTVVLSDMGQIDFRLGFDTTTPTLLNGRHTATTYGPPVTHLAGTFSVTR